MQQLHRSAVIEGRVFCRLQDRAVAVDNCFDCSHIRAANEHGTSPFIVCDTGSRRDEEDGGQPILRWWLKASRRPSSPQT